MSERARKIMRLVEMMEEKSETGSRIPDEENLPLNKEYLPVNEEYLPVNEEYLPVNEENLPVIEEYLPVNEENLPVNEENLPVNEENLPVNEENLPVNEQNLQVNEENLPVNEQNLPVNEENLPVNEENLPVNEENLPVNEEYLPVSEEHNHSKSENNQTLPPQQSSCENHNENSDWEIAEASTTRINLRKVKKIQYSALANTSDSDISEKLMSSGSSDDYGPSSATSENSSSEDSSSEDSSKPIDSSLVTPNDPIALNDNENETSNEIKKGKKRSRNVNNWKKVKNKLLKNSGQSYTSRSGKIVEAREMGPPCGDGCILSCSKRLTEELRTELFRNYWQLGTLQRQRDFLISCIEPLILKNRRQTSQKPRRPNTAFYVMDGEKRIRVCKTNLINTLGISERTIRTVIAAKVEGNGIAPADKRGRHENRKKLPEEVANSVRDHINSVPQIESHYVRKDTSREFIDGGLTIAEMHQHYSAERLAANKPFANYDAFCRIFNTKFNIGFFLPKKDQCDQCEAYKNAVGEEKDKLAESFNQHQEEKELSRKEKAADKERAEKGEIQLAVYDLQAILPVPIGQTSAFFYKSRLNCFNFTVTEIKNDNTFCFFWHEGLGHRGVNEIATCVYKYIEEVSNLNPGQEIIFYSDNCGGQQKNRYMMAMYLYAVENLNVKSITHKYLIRGHTQNEGDTIHSIIERSIARAKRLGPVYVPDQYVTLIRNAKKKGKPLQVKEMSFQDFFDMKELHSKMNLKIVKDTEGYNFKLSDVKVLRFVKGSDTFFFKYSYKSEWSEIQCNSSSKRRASVLAGQPWNTICLKPAFPSRIALPDNKKKT